MRYLSRSLVTGNRLSLPTSAALGVALLVAAGTAGAQPAPAPHPAPQPAAPAPAAPPPAAAPAHAPAGEPLMPPAAAAAPDPDRDAKALAAQGAQRPSLTPAAAPAPAPTTPLPPATPATPAAHPPSPPNGDVAARPSDVFAEDWWSGARPTFEIHGYFRVRAEMFHNFALGRQDMNLITGASNSNLWPQPIDNTFQPVNGSGATQGAHPVYLCGPANAPTACTDNTQAGANMRFRINPELHISDNLRVMAQIDMLDNLVLGSTPEGYYNTPTGVGYQAAARGGYTPLGVFSTTQWAPTAGVNSTQNSITVKRAWGEFMTPVGMLRFGRMPSNWGLGMVANSGDGYDSDYQTTADRIMFVTGIKSLDLYFAGMWDFANEGLASATFSQQQGQPYDLGQLDDVNQFGLVAVRRRDPELQRLDLAHGLPVFNGGMYFIYRNQVLAQDQGNTATGMGNPGIGTNSTSYSQGLSRRGAWAVIPDLWLQFLYKKFRFEAEGAMIYGYMDTNESVATGTTTGAAIPGYQNTLNPNDNGYHVRQFGVATQSEFRAIEDRLRVGFGFGWASGDPGLPTLAPPANGLPIKQVPGDRTYTEFAFHPDYRVDLILFRNILSRVEGAYYFRPNVEYDFLRDKNGQKLGGGAALIWSRASEFIQTPGHAHDLGVELDGKIYFQSRDGTLNDDPDKMGGFYTQLEYGVMFPLAGLGFMPGQQTNYANTSMPPGQQLSTSIAQTLRWYIGILY